MAFEPTPAELARRDQVMEAILADIRAGQTIRLPEYNKGLSSPSERFALLSVGLEPNPYGGEAGDFRYQFEGEDDLLHLMIVRKDSLPLAMEESRPIVSFLLPQVPPGLIWPKPAEFSQHFYVGHDVLLEAPGHDSDKK